MSHNSKERLKNYEDSHNSKFLLDISDLKNELRHKQNLIQNIESGKRNISAFEQDLIKRSQQLQSKNQLQLKEDIKSSKTCLNKDQNFSRIQSRQKTNFIQKDDFKLSIDLKSKEDEQRQMSVLNKNESRTNNFHNKYKISSFSNSNQLLSNQSNNEVFSETTGVNKFEKLNIVPKINLDSSIGTTQRNTRLDSYRKQSIDKNTFERSISRNQKFKTEDFQINNNQILNINNNQIQTLEIQKKNKNQSFENQQQQVLQNNYLNPQRIIYMKQSNQEKSLSRNNQEENQSFLNQKVYIPLRSKSRSPSYQATIRSPQNHSSQRNQISEKQDISSRHSQARVYSNNTNCIQKSYSQQQSRQQLIELKDTVLRNLEKQNFKEDVDQILNKDFSQILKTRHTIIQAKESECKVNSSIDENGNHYILTTQGGSANQDLERQSSRFQQKIIDSKKSMKNNNLKVQSSLKSEEDNLSNDESDDDSNRYDESLADGNLTEPPQIQSSQMQSRIKKNKLDNIIYKQQIQILQDFPTNNSREMDTTKSINFKQKGQELNSDIQQIPQKIKRYSNKHHTGGSFGNLNEMQLAMLENQNKENIKSTDFNLINYYNIDSQQSQNYIKPLPNQNQITSSNSQILKNNKKPSKIELKMHNHKIEESIQNQSIKEYSETNHNESNMTNKLTQKDSFQQRIDSSIDCEITKIESQTLQAKHRKFLGDNILKNSLERISQNHSLESKDNKFIIKNNWYQKRNGSKKHSVMSKSSSSTTLGSILFKKKGFLLKNKRNNEEINKFDQQESNKNRLDILKSTYSGKGVNMDEFVDKNSKKMKNEKQVAFRSNSIMKDIKKKSNFIDSLISPKRISKVSLKQQKIRKDLIILQKSINSRKSSNSKKSKKKVKSQKRSGSLDQRSNFQEDKKQQKSQKKQKSLSNPKSLKQSIIKNSKNRISYEAFNNERRQKNEKPPHKSKLNTIQYNIDSIERNGNNQNTRSQKMIHRQNNTISNIISKKSRSNSRASKKKQQPDFDPSIDQSIGQRLLYDIASKYRAMEKDIRAQGNYNINRTGNCQNITIQTTQRNQMLHDIQLLANALIKSEKKIIKDKSISKMNSKKLKEIIESQEQIMGLMQQKIDKMQGKVDKLQNQGETACKELSNERELFSREHDHIKAELKNIKNKNQSDKEKWSSERKTIIIEFEKELQIRLKQQKNNYEIELKTLKSENKMLKLSLKENKNLEQKFVKLQNEYKQSIEILNEQQETIDQLKKVNNDFQYKIQEINLLLDSSKIENLKQIDLQNQNIIQINNKFEIKIKKLKFDHENELNKFKVAKNMEEYTLKFQSEDKLNEKESKIQQLEQILVEKKFIIEQHQQNLLKEKQNINQNEKKLFENIKQIEIEKERTEYENENLQKQIQNFQIIIEYKDKHILQLNQNLKLNVLGEKSNENQENYIKELQSQIDNYIKVFKELHIQLRQQKMIEKQNYQNTELEIKGYNHKIDQQQQEIQILAQGFQAQQAKLNSQKLVIEKHSKISTGQFNRLQINHTNDYDEASNVITFNNKDDEAFYQHSQTMQQNNQVNSNTASLIGEQVIYDCAKPQEDFRQVNSGFTNVQQMYIQNQEHNSQNMTSQETDGQGEEQSEGDQNEYSQENYDQIEYQNDYLSQQNNLNTDILEQKVFQYKNPSNDNLGNLNNEQNQINNYISSEYNSQQYPFEQNKTQQIEKNVYSLQCKKRKNNPTFGEENPQNLINQNLEVIDYPQLEEIQNNTINNKSKQFNPCYSSTLLSRQEILSQKENSSQLIQQFNNQEIENHYQQQLQQKEMEKQYLLNIIQNIQREKYAQNNSEALQRNESSQLLESNSVSVQNIEMGNKNIYNNNQISSNSLQQEDLTNINSQNFYEEQFLNSLSEEQQVQYISQLNIQQNQQLHDNRQTLINQKSYKDVQQIESQSTKKDKSNSQITSQNSQSNISNLPNLGAFPQLSSGIITTSGLQQLKNLSFNKQFPVTAIVSHNLSQNKKDNVEVKSQVQSMNQIFKMDENNNQDEQVQDGFESVNIKKYLKEAEDEEICNENESSYNYLKESNNSLNSVNKKELFDAKQRIRKLIQLNQD